MTKVYESYLDSAWPQTGPFVVCLCDLEECVVVGHTPPYYRQGCRVFQRTDGRWVVCLRGRESLSVRKVNELDRIVAQLKEGLRQMEAAEIS